MQQLLGDKVGMTDGSFLRELFLQCLPANVHMVLTSTGDKELAQVADKIVEVAVPSVSAVSVPQLTTEVEQLRADVTHLTELVRKSLSSRGRPMQGHSPSPAQPCPPTDPSLCWCHQHFGDATQKCKAPCSKLETIWPVATGDECY